jgi:hypothetical protein
MTTAPVSRWTTAPYAGETSRRPTSRTSSGATSETVAAATVTHPIARLALASALCERRVARVTTPRTMVAIAARTAGGAIDETALLRPRDTENAPTV